MEKHSRIPFKDTHKDNCGWVWAKVADRQGVLVFVADTKHGVYRVSPNDLNQEGPPWRAERWDFCVFVALDDRLYKTTQDAIAACHMDAEDRATRRW